MDFSIFVASFCVTLSLMISHCSSDAVPQQISGHDLHLQQVLDRPSMFRYSAPRKLKLEEQPMRLKSLTGRGEASDEKYLFEVLSGEQKQQENEMMHARKSTWVEDTDKSEYFTMDYHWVRRRRPIHNMQIPFVP